MFREGWKLGKIKLKKIGKLIEPGLRLKDGQLK